jgi:hypothetical protein
MMILFSIFLILIVVTTLNTLKTDYEDFVAKNEMLQVCAMIKSSVEKLYWPQSYIPQTNTVMGSITINLPREIARVEYNARFSNRTLVVTTIEQPKVNDTCEMGFDISFSGRTSGGRTKIKWTRYSNGTDMITMENV